jgi:hypothetical protein
MRAAALRLMSVVPLEPRLPPEADIEIDTYAREHDINL